MKLIHYLLLKKMSLGTRRFLEVFLAFLMFYAVFVLYGAAIPVGDLNDEGDVTIYVQSTGVHTDVILPASNQDVDWREFIPIEAFADTCTFDFITIGWGDKGFFLDTPTWAELKFSTALNAAFLPSSTAMHVMYSGEPKVTEMRKEVHLTHEQYNKLIRFIKRSFELKNDQVDLIDRPGYTPADRFYEAYYSYHMFRTCNSWTNDALKSAEVKTGVYALFPDGILRHLN